MKKGGIVLSLSIAAIMSGCGGGGSAPSNMQNASANNENTQINSQSKKVSFKASDAYVVKLNSSAKLEINGKIYESHKVEKNGTIIFENIPKDINLSKAIFKVPSDAIVDSDLDGEYNASIDKQIRMPLVVKGDAKVANPIATAALEHNDSKLYEMAKAFDPVKAKEKLLDENNETLEKLVALSDTIAEVVKKAKENNITKDAKEILKDINITACKEALENKDENVTQVIEKALKPLEKKHQEIAEKVKEKTKAVLEVLYEAKTAHKEKEFDKKDALKAILVVSDGDVNATTIKQALKEGKKGKELEDVIEQEIKKKWQIPHKNKNQQEHSSDDIKDLMPINDSNKNSHKENNETLNQPITQIDSGIKENNHTNSQMPTNPGKKEHNKQENNASTLPINNPNKNNSNHQNNNSNAITTPPKQEIDPGVQNNKGKAHFDANTTQKVKIKASDAYVVALPTAATLKVGNKEFNSTKVEANGTIVFEVPHDINISKAYFHIPKDAIVDVDGDGNLSEADQIIRMPLFAKGKDVTANPITTAMLEKNATKLYEKVKNFDPVKAKEELIENPNNEHLKKLVALSEAIAKIAQKAQENDANTTAILQHIDFEKLQEIIESNKTFKEAKLEFAKIFKNAKEEAGIDENISKEVEDFIELIKKVHEKFANAKDKKAAKKEAMFAVLANSDGGVESDIALTFESDTIKSALKEKATQKIKHFIAKYPEWVNKHQTWIDKHQSWINYFKNIKDEHKSNHSKKESNTSDFNEVNKTKELPKFDNDFKKDHGTKLPHLNDINKTDESMPKYNDVNSSRKKEEKKQEHNRPLPSFGNDTNHSRSNLDFNKEDNSSKVHFGDINKTRKNKSFLKKHNNSKSHFNDFNKSKENNHTMPHFSENNESMMQKRQKHQEKEHNNTMPSFEDLNKTKEHNNSMPYFNDFNKSKENNHTMLQRNENNKTKKQNHNFYENNNLNSSEPNISNKKSQKTKGEGESFNHKGVKEKNNFKD